MSTNVSAPSTTAIEHPSKKPRTEVAAVAVPDVMMDTPLPVHAPTLSWATGETVLRFTIYGRSPHKVVDFEHGERRKWWYMAFLTTATEEEDDGTTTEVKLWEIKCVWTKGDESARNEMMADIARRVTRSPPEEEDEWVDLEHENDEVVAFVINFDYSPIVSELHM